MIIKIQNSINLPFRVMSRYMKLKGCPRDLYLFMLFTNWDGYVITSLSYREYFAKVMKDECGVDYSQSSINKAIRAIADSGLIIRQERGVYKVK